MTPSPFFIKLALYEIFEFFKGVFDEVLVEVEYTVMLLLFQGTLVHFHLAVIDCEVIGRDQWAHQVKMENSTI